MTNPLRAILLLFLVILSGEVYSFEPAAKDSSRFKKFVQDFFNPPKDKKLRVYPLAEASYGEVTRLRVGGTVQMLIRFGHGKEKLTSKIDLPRFFYTMNKQMGVGFKGEFYLNKYRAEAKFEFRRYPNSFYGIGNNTNYADKEQYNVSFLTLDLEGVRKVYKDLYVGLQYEFEKTLRLSYKENGILEREKIKGANGYQNSGFGPMVQYDTRDNNIFPTKGCNVRFKSIFYVPFLGSDSYVATYEFLGTKYIDLRKGTHILVLDGQVVFNDNTPVFTKMNQLGGDDALRGHKNGLYRDKNLAIGQMEYRFPIYWRFRGVAYAGVGDVFNNFSDFSWKTLKYCFGTGLRLVLDPKEKVSIRFDYAVGRDWQHGYYLGLNEIF